MGFDHELLNVGFRMRRSGIFRAGSLVVLGSFLVALAALAGCGDERNNPPTVEISASSLEIVEGDVVQVDGSESSDPDGDPLRFYWELEAPEASTVEFMDPRTDNISFAADVPGTYTVSLSVSDGEFRVGPESVSIEAQAYIPEEGEPEADAGADQTVEVGEEVELDGSASVDPDGDELSYEWTMLEVPDDSSAELDDATAVKPRFTPDKAGEYLVGLTVSDGTHTSRQARVTITAVEDIEGNNGNGENNGDNDIAPIADAGEAPEDAAVGRRVDLDGSGSSNPNGDDDDLSYEWIFESRPEASGNNISISNPLSANAWFRPDAEGVFKVRLEVRDAAQNLATDTVEINVVRQPSDACLMISEYVHGSGNNKAVALHNCGDETLDMRNFRFCMFNNEQDSECTHDVSLLRDDDTSHSDGQHDLAADDVLTLCGSLNESDFDPDDCDRSSGTYLNNLTGDDRFFVYEDTDESNSYSGVDLIIDAFGETRVRPSDDIWKRYHFQRCNFEFYDGRTPFDYADYYNRADNPDDFSGFGEPPTEGCD